MIRSDTQIFQIKSCSDDYYWLT